MEARFLGFLVSFHGYARKPTRNSKIQLILERHGQIRTNIKVFFHIRVPLCTFNKLRTHKFYIQGKGFCLSTESGNIYSFVLVKKWRRQKVQLEITFSPFRTTNI